MSTLSNAKIVAVVGTTASGKTKLGVDLARKFNGEIVSADSRQVYKGMDVGTGKDLADYKVKTWFGKTVDIPYHLIDIAEPSEDFDLAQFQKKAYQVIDDISARGKLPILVGGTGLYAQAVVEGYQLSEAGRDEKLRQQAEAKDLDQLWRDIRQLDPDFAARINTSDRNNKVRLVRYWEKLKQGSKNKGVSRSPRYNSLVLGVTYPRNKLEQRIYTRLIERLEQEGMIEEVENLHDQGLSWPRLERFGLEYKWVAYYLQGKIDYREMVDNFYQEINKFDQRQVAWLKRWEKQGRKIHWIKNKKQARSRVKKFLKE